jgi:UDP-2,3-diacylglucosamine pyrophosphatase LpxH
MTRREKNPGARPSGSLHVHALFISDVHLGTRSSQAKALASLLREYDADEIYIVGDFIDGWQLQTQWYWPQDHNDLVQKLLRKARKRTRITYIPGNHDEFLRPYCGTKFGKIRIVEQALHTTVDGRRLLVIHGDIFDLVVTKARWLAVIGGYAYDAAVLISRRLNVVRRLFGFPYWSLSQWAKDNVKNATRYVGDFESMLAREARRQGADGVVCGHIHHAAIRDIEGIQYLNCGDWVESCTALVEHHDGRLEIIDWAAQTTLELQPSDWRIV